MADGRAAAIVLAAGRGRRFGGPTKQLARRGGEPLVAVVVRSALAAGLDEVVVVVGHDRDAVVAALPDAPAVRVSENPVFARGQSGSVRTGFAALGDDVAVAVVLLADQPDVTPLSIRAVVAAVTGGASIARAHHDDGPSHPIAFGRRTWEMMAGLTGDEGARQVLADADVTDVHVPGPRPTDIDRPTDL